MNFLLDGRSKEQKIQDAVELLRENGYVVRGPIIVKEQVKNSRQLVRFFYDTMMLYRPARQYSYSGSPQRDSALAKALIESRINSGVGRARAIQESCDLIELLFEHEARLNLSLPITSMNVLGQDRMGWITERLISIKEGLDASVNAAENANYYEELWRQQEESVNREDLERAKNSMDKVLERYAEKEE